MTWSCSSYRGIRLIDYLPPMKTRPPITITASLVLLGGRLLVGITLLIFSAATIDVGLEGQGLLFDLKRAVYEKFGLEGEDQAYLFGLLLGNLLIPGLGNIVSLIAIAARKYYLSIIFLALDFLFIMYKALPMVPIIVLVLIFLPPSRAYFGLQRREDGNMTVD